MKLKDYGGTEVPALQTIDFVLKDGSTYELGEPKVVEYINTYDDVDVIKELKAARQWLIDNPRKRKTSRGMGKYLNSWLKRAQDRQGKQQHNFKDINF